MARKRTVIDSLWSTEGAACTRLVSDDMCMNRHIVLLHLLSPPDVHMLLSCCFPLSSTHASSSSHLHDHQLSSKLLHAASCTTDC